MKVAETRFCYKFRRPDSRRELLRAWDKAGVLVNRPLAPKPVIEDGIDEYEEALTARYEAEQTAETNAVLEARFEACVLECADCGGTFDGSTVPVGLACPHCGNTDW
jgi:hypothetical protein